MPTILTFLLRALLVAAGLVFAASLALVFLAVLVFWAVRPGWAKLTGRPVAPFIVRMRPRDGFDRMYRRTQPRYAGDRRPIADVTDVEPK